MVNAVYFKGDKRKMTVRELAEFVLNHDIDEVVAKCEEILNEEEEND